MKDDWHLPPEAHRPIRRHAPLYDSEAQRLKWERWGIYLLVGGGIALGLGIAFTH